MMAEIFLEAGYPKGVINIISGSGSVAGEAMLRNDDVNMVSFTGSTEVGRRCLHSSAETNLKKCCLNLAEKDLLLLTKIVL